MPNKPSSTEARLQAALDELPLIAILRGLPTTDAVAVVEELCAAGIKVAEVPLNSPTPFDTIALLVERFGDRMLIGAGTVTEVGQVDRLAACGAALCVSPNTNPDVIAAVLRHGMVPIPGFQTVSEALVAFSAGARLLKLFPSVGRSADLAAMKAVLPKAAQIVAVGGVTPQNLSEFRHAGAVVAGIGSELYRAGDRVEMVRARASAWAAVCRSVPWPAAVKVLCHPIASIGETPVWRESDRTVIWVDGVQGKLMSCGPGDAHARVVALDAQVFSIAALPDGRLAGALASGMCHVDDRTGRTRPGPSAELAPGCRLNDFTVDQRGGIWVGSMHIGALATRGSIHYAPSVDSPIRCVASGLGIPNGMAIDQQAQILYAIDTLARQLLAYPVDLDSGKLYEPRLVSDFMGVPGKPDGMTIAADGSLWVAMWGGGCVVQIAANGGAVLQRVSIPAPQVSSVCIDGSGRLLVSTSRMRLNDQELAASPASGALFVVSPKA